MMLATLMLAAFLSLIVFLQTLVEYWRSHGKRADREQCQAARKMRGQSRSAATHVDGQ
jgi:hypothetical protein